MLLRIWIQSRTMYGTVMLEIEMKHYQGIPDQFFLGENLFDTACAFDICLYLTPSGQARQFIETCGT